MKNRLSAISFLVLFINLCAAQTSTNLGIEAAETFVQLSPRDGYLHIKEYFVSTLEEDDEERFAQIKKVKDLVQKSQYSKSRFGLEGFTAIEEKMFENRGFVTGEYHLLSREKNLKSLMGAAFGGILGRDVSITIAKEDIGLHFSGNDLVIRGNNSKGMFAKENRRVIFWRNGVNKYEAVFASANKQQDDFVSVTPYFGKDIASPEWSRAEVEAWKRAE